jgi:LysR family transcriptional regulator, transcriptional activator AphB
MSLSYDDVAIFLNVARAGSFVGAARSLRMPVSTVSRRVAALEARLKTQLLRRTTRAVSLTDDGRAFADRCGQAVEEIEAAADALLVKGPNLRGTIRVTAPHFACSEMFGPYLLEFAAAHPDLVMDLRLTDTTPDLVEEGIDLAFQFGPLRDGRYLARKLWPVRYMLCASSHFIDRHLEVLELTHPRELTRFPCVLTPPLDVWAFERGGDGATTFAPQVLAATIDDLALGAVAVRRGVGLGYLPESLALGNSAEPVIEVGLGGWRPRARELFAVYPASRQLSAKVRAAIDHAVAGLDWYKRQPPGKAPKQSRGQPFKERALAAE